MGPYRRRKKKFDKRVLAAVTILTGSLIALIGVRSGLQNSGPSPSANRPASARRSQRPVYPYSVIPGGAYNAQELRGRLKADGVAARHYQSFDLTHLKITKANSNAAVYLSYRKGKSIFWTRKAIHLYAGEVLLTDGKFYARARCGNRISTVPQQPVADPAEAEASEQLLNTPGRGLPAPTVWSAALDAEDFADRSDTEMASATHLTGSPRFPHSAGSLNGSGPFLGIRGARRENRVALGRGKSAEGDAAEAGVQPFSPDDSPNEPFAAVPEPDSFLLLITAVTTIAGLQRWRRRASPKSK